MALRKMKSYRSAKGGSSSILINASKEQNSEQDDIRISNSSALSGTSQLGRRRLVTAQKKHFNLQSFCDHNNFLSRQLNNEY